MPSDFETSPAAAVQTPRGFDGGFTKFLKETVADESVPAGIPPAVPWDDLAAKKKWTTTQLKKAQAVRGKLNVPRERFRQTEDGELIWAGKKVIRFRNDDVPKYLRDLDKFEEASKNTTLVVS